MTQKSEQTAFLQFYDPKISPYRIFWHPQDGYFVALSDPAQEGEGELPQVERVVVFTENELSFLTPLLVNHQKTGGQFCPIEVLLASFRYTKPTEQQIAKCRSEYNRTTYGEERDQLVRPIRNLASRVRLKLNPFGFSFVSILETGYILIAESKHFQRHGLEKE